MDSETLMQKDNRNKKASHQSTKRNNVRELVRRNQQMLAR